MDKSTGPLRILVYSDRARVREQVRLALGNRIRPELPNCSYVDVATAPVVFKQVASGNVDIAILDGEARPSGGMGIAKQLRDESTKCPTIVLLIGRPDDLWLAQWSGAEAVVQHPIDPFKLAESVVALLESDSAVDGDQHLRTRTGSPTPPRTERPTDTLESSRLPTEQHTASAKLKSVEPPDIGSSMLNDADLKILYPTLMAKPLPTDVDGARSPIQPASLDLSIGEIHVPGAKPGELGAVETPQTEAFSLSPGHTVVVTTLEELSIPPTHGAIGFPPTTISNNGILMTNPGHVDPGFKGRLTFTVINMGRQPFELRPGARIVTILFFRLDRRPDKDYEERRTSSGPTPMPEPVTRGRMDRLAPDMLDVDRRVKAITDDAESKTRRLAIWVPLALALVVGAGTIIAPIVSNLLSQNADLQRRVSVLEDRKNQEEIQKRLDQLEQQVSTSSPPPAPGAPSGTR